MTSTEAISSLNDKVDNTLRAVLPRGTACALLDFPNYSNVGDSAIWLGARRWLARNGNPVVYLCDQVSYSHGTLARLIGAGTILLTGGGNFGDLWPHHQEFRERIIRDFTGSRIIQLPQSISFRMTSNIARTRRVLTRHPNLTLLVRDVPSLEFARRELDVPSMLCPDMAFSLGAISRPTDPQTEIVWLSRTDKESSISCEPANQPGIERMDWLEEKPSAVSNKYDRLTSSLALQVEKWEEIGTQFMRVSDLLAKERLLRGCTMLARGEVVVSNRLHAHILSLLMDIPNIVLDNSYGKVANFFNCWTRECATAVAASSPDDVLRRVFRAPQLRAVLKGRGVDLSSLDDLLASVEAGRGSGDGWITGQELARNTAKMKQQKLQEELLEAIPAYQSFILVDDEQLRCQLELTTRIPIPFLERDGVYWGSPADDKSAIDELNRLRLRGASHIAFAWPAFWWRHHYLGFFKYLDMNCLNVVRSERLLIYDLRGSPV